MPRPKPQIALLKATIHLPEDVLIAAHKAAQQSGTTFSRWLVAVLREKLHDAVIDGGA